MPINKICVVPGCLASRSDPKHSFPKKSWSAERWRKAVNSPMLTDVKTENLHKFSVCYKHFTENDYGATQKRRRLNISCIPSQNLGNLPITLGNNAQDSSAMVKLTRDPMDTTRITSEMSSFVASIFDADNTENVTERAEETSASTTSTSSADVFVESQQEIQLELTSDATNDSPTRNTARRKKSRLANEKRVLRQGASSKQLLQFRRLQKERPILLQKIRRQERRLRVLEKTANHPLIKQWDKLNVAQKTFLEMQLTHADKPPKGRRYTSRQKMMGLVMFKWGPQYYRRLSSSFILPGSTTVHNLLRTIPCHTGSNPVVMEKLKNCAATMEDKEKYCVLCWDEMKLTTHLQYDKSTDEFVGFEDWRYRRSSRFADHAILFMLRGINSGWKMPVFYGFCDSQTEVPDLMRCIKIVVKAVEETGLKIVASVCDQLSINVAAINKLIRQSNDRRLKNGEKSSEAFTYK